MNKQKALQKCMDLCSRKEYAVSDIQKKLEKWEVSLEESAQIIEQLKQEKFIDEQRFADAFVKDKFRFNHWGRIKIKMHLKQKRIDDILINNAFNELNEEEYLEVLEGELQKKKRTVKGKNVFDVRNKLARYAISKGFEPYLVFETLKMESFE